MLESPAWAPVSGVSFTFGLSTGVERWETEGPTGTLYSVAGIDAENSAGPVVVCALSASPLDVIVTTGTDGNLGASIVGTNGKLFLGAIVGEVGIPNVSVATGASAFGRKGASVRLVALSSVGMASLPESCSRAGNIEGSNSSAELATGGSVTSSVGSMNPGRSSKSGGGPSS